jgi:cellulose biosynthesis protein BcsQ
MMRDTVRYQDAIQVVEPGRYAPAGEAAGTLYLLPGNEESRSVGEMQRDPYRVLRRLGPVADIVDVAVFDTSPTPSRLNTLVLTASDDIIIPTQLEAWSFKGIQKSLSAIDQVNQLRRADGLPNVLVRAFVPTMTQLGTMEHAENLKEITRVFGGQVWRPLSRRIVWGESTSARLSIFAYANNTEAAADGWRLVEAVEDML